MLWRTLALLVAMYWALWGEEQGCGERGGAEKGYGRLHYSHYCCMLACDRARECCFCFCFVCARAHIRARPGCVGAGV